MFTPLSRIGRNHNGICSAVRPARAYLSHLETTELVLYISPPLNSFLFSFKGKHFSEDLINLTDDLFDMLGNVLQNDGNLGMFREL